MQYIPGSSVTLSASLSYLAKNLPDDSDVQTHVPQICVDYLSHEWLEEDVWKSWRNMTRHKNEVTNGVRLENASWRTWWKQRNKLKTVSPETLNWLKDSDVTWLYGPLHTAAEPVPPPKQSTTEERFNLVKASGKKPILKHRTISELLNIPSHDVNAASVPQGIGSPALEAVGNLPPESREGSPRPNLPHTKSDSHIVRRSSASSGRSSPPRVTVLDAYGKDGESISRSMSPSNSDGLAGSTSNLSVSTPAKRHISFNTFVEQYISIDDPSAPSSSAYDDSDGGIVDDDEEEEEDDSSLSSVLEMNAGARRPAQRAPAPGVRSNSTSQERERMTIAPIPPTSLKTSGDFPAPSPQVVYVPPKEFIWEVPSTTDVPPVDSPISDLSGASGSIAGVPVDLGFVAPQWGRAPAPPGTVGSGAAGPAGPSDLFQANVYEVSGYEEPHRPALSTSPPSKGIGYGAGRSKWVPGGAADDDDEEDEDGDEPADNSSDALSEGDDAEETQDKHASTSTVVSGSSSSTTSDARTVIAAARSPPSSVRSGSSRGSSQPSKSILKNAAAGGAIPPPVLGHEPSSGGTSAGPAAHSNPIGIPKASISHPLPPPPAPTSNGYSQLPPTATISAPPNGSGPSVGFLSPTQHEVIFFGSPAQGAPPSTGRGRTSTRSATSSSGISDRSRSSSKISGTSSPLGSVSPSGHGSPSSSRASSVLGNRRSSTDVGVVVGRSTAAGVGAGGRNSLRQASTSPPAVSSPLINSTLPASSLGTIVANVPLDTASATSSNGNGPPLSRSGRSNSTLGIGAPRVSRPRLGPRTNSASSVSSSGSGSGSSGSTSTAGAPRTPKDNVSIVLPPAPLPVQAVTAAAKKPSVALPLGEPRPHVIISPQAATQPDRDRSAASSAGASPSGGTTMSLEARDHKLEEAMRKAKMQQQQVNNDPDPDDDVSDAGETDVGTFVEEANVNVKSTNPTPSNSPVLGFAKVVSPAAAPATPKGIAVPPPSLASPPLVASPRPKSSPSDAVVTPTFASADDPIATAPPPGATIVGKAADTLVSSAKGLLGAIWGMGGQEGGPSVATASSSSASR